MQSIRKCIRFVSSNTFSVNNSNCLPAILRSVFLIPSNNIHESSVLNKFLDYNKVIFPPQKPDEERRPGYVCNAKLGVKYSPDNMWYIACFVRGMTVDEAVKQLSFLHKKGAAIVKETILEAQSMAKDHNIEFQSNLWVAESFATKGGVIKGIRRHGRGRKGIVHYRYTNYYVRLEEGKPPKHYYLPAPKSSEELLQDWLDKMHSRRINRSL
ncbi:mitochondrial ribosomal protein L22 [Ptiloglossa arizonensis]|uniref:mitochondrial ribosomal protein L22 n=1 Tax=Ptiloglossa arizonensis TaxID=3350558 RepID=UPI003F9F9417